MQNDTPAPESAYTITDGKITFHELGIYNVTMTNEAIISSEDYPAKVSVELTVTDVGVNEHGLLNITVYPNPTTGKLTIETSDMRYEIFDIYGRKLISDIRYPISEIGKSEIEINISHLPAGIYFVKVGNETVKVVKK